MFKSIVGVAVFCCGMSGSAFAQSYTFTAEQMAGVVQGFQYLTMCPVEDDWRHLNNKGGNCIGGETGGPEQANGGG